MDYKLVMMRPISHCYRTRIHGHISALRGKKVVLYFYPKDNTPG